MNLIRQILTPAEDRVYIGASDSDLQGFTALKAALEQHAASIKDIRVTAATDVTIYPLLCGQAAYAKSLWAFVEKMSDQQLLLPVRCTWILKRNSTDWMLVHFHKSVGTTVEPPEFLC